jgi:hypothetical protein
MIPRGKNLVTTFAECLNHACRLAAATGTREAAIAVHTKHNVHGAIESVLGPRITNQLLAGNAVISGVHFHLITERIKSKLVRGPLIAAYVSPRFLDILLDDKRASHLIFLPWNPQEEAAFFAEHRPEILSPPPGWIPSVQSDGDDTDASFVRSAGRTRVARHDDNIAGPAEEDALGEHIRSIRTSLQPEERVLPLEHTIDPGFVNYRRIETIIGPEGCKAIDQAIRQLPEMPEWQRSFRIGHIYSDIMLAFCRVLDAPPLGQLVAERRGRLFCSTERVGPCRDFGKSDQAVNRWKPPGRSGIRVEFHYSTHLVISDTLRSELRRGSTLSIIGELHSASNHLVMFRPLVMGGPWLDSPDPKWKDVVMWWGHEFFENVIENFDEFSRVRQFPKPGDYAAMKEVSEATFKTCLSEIVGGEPPKDWGGETSDFFTAHLHLGGRRVSGAFLLKGPAKFSPMRLNTLGKNNDQIVRLAHEPAEVLFVQHCHEITPPVRETLRAFAVQPSRPRRYCVIDGRDSLWLLQAYGLYEKALALSKKMSDTKRAG